MIGSIKLNRLRRIALKNLLVELRKRTYHGKPIQESTVQKYLTVVSAVLSDAKRNEIIEKNPARMIDLPDTTRRVQMIPTDAAFWMSSPTRRTPTRPFTPWRFTPAAGVVSCAR